MPLFNPSQLTSSFFVKQPRVMMFGDSIPAAASRLVSGYQTMSSRGWLNWINAQTGFKFYYDNTLNKGVSGDTSTASLARWNTDVAANFANFDWLWIHVGTNDPTNAISPATTLANLTTMITLATAANKIVVVDTILPRGSPNAFTGTQQLQAAAVNYGIRQLCTQYPNMLTFDPWRDIADPTNGGAPYSNSTLDGIHPNMSLANAMGQRFVQQYGPLLDYYPSATQQQWDTYDATNNPHGNLLPNPAMTGTGGSLTGTALTGNIATSWSMITATGTAGAGTVVLSKVAPTPGYGCAGTEAQKIVFNIPSGNSTQETFQLRCDLYSGAPASGSGSFYTQCELDISGVVGCYWLDLAASNYDGAAIQVTLFNEQDGYGTAQSLVAGHYMFRTQPVPLTYSSTPFVRLALDFGFNCVSNAGQMTVSITNAQARMA